MFRTKKTVIHISIDGWRPETIEYMPNIQKIISEGFFSLARSDEQHTNTLPNHLSMLSSVPVSEHKWVTNFPNKSIKTNIHINKGSYQQSIFDHLRNNKLSSSVIIQKERLYKIITDSYNMIDEKINQDSNVFPTYKTEETIQSLILSILKKRKNYYFVHLQGPDLLGHSDKLEKNESRPWGFNPLNPKMAEVLLNIDHEIGKLYKLIKKSYSGKCILIISSDHGGISDSNDHYKDPTNPQNNTIPMIIWGLGHKDVKLEKLVRNRYIGNFACKYLEISHIPESEVDGYEMFGEIFG